MLFYILGALLVLLGLLGLVHILAIGLAVSIILLVAGVLCFVLPGRV